MTDIARLNSDGDTSLRMWRDRLKDRGYSVVYEPVSAQASGERSYIFGWVSPWQKKVRNSSQFLISELEFPRFNVVIVLAS